MTKECNFCHAIKPLDQFRHGAKCRDCERIYDFNRREKKAEYLKEYFQINPDKRKKPKLIIVGPHSKIYVRTCKFSGEKFVTTDKGAFIKPGLEELYKQFISTQWQKINRKSWLKFKASPRIKKTCPDCGREFKPIFTRARYCPDCRAIANHRHQKAKAKAIKYNTHVIEHVGRYTLFDAYHWTCAVCRQPTPKDLVGTCLPNAPTVDHIIPFSKGGDHSYDNCQLLCFACNCAKNDAIDPPDELVIAGNLLINLNHTIHEAERRTVECR